MEMIIKYEIRIAISRPDWSYSYVLYIGILYICSTYHEICFKQIFESVLLGILTVNDPTVIARITDSKLGFSWRETFAIASRDRTLNGLKIK